MNEALSARELAVLKAVVRTHIATGQPVGSGAIAGTPELRLSPATIRKILGQLTDLGYLSQPHTSAGRVPGDRGYRAYVDLLLEHPPSLGRTQVDEIDRALADASGELPVLLGASSRQLSQLSRQVGVVLAPEVTRISFDRFEFVPLAPCRVLAILVGRSGVVYQRTLTLDESIDADELDRAGRFLTAEHPGRTLPEILASLERRAGEDRAGVEVWLQHGVTLCRRAVAAEAAELDVFVEGASTLLGTPGWTDLDALRKLLHTLEEKRRLIELLGQLVDGDGVRALIGSENPVAELGHCTIVASTYGSPGRTLGTVGVVGPVRMQYSRVIPIVGHLAALLTARLSPPESTDN